MTIDSFDERISRSLPNSKRLSPIIEKIIINLCVWYEEINTIIKILTSIGRTHRPGYIVSARVVHQEYIINIIYFLQKHYTLTRYFQCSVYNQAAASNCCPNIGSSCKCNLNWLINSCHKNTIFRYIQLGHRATEAIKFIHNLFADQLKFIKIGKCELKYKLFPDIIGRTPLIYLIYFLLNFFFSI